MTTDLDMAARTAVSELRDQIAGTIHRRICEHSRDDCNDMPDPLDRARAYLADAHAIREVKEMTP